MSPGKVFDRVVVKESDGRTREYSDAEYRALPLRQRVQMLVEGKASFFLRSNQVAASVAIKST